MSVVLDAGALIALERRDPRMLALAEAIGHDETPAFVPAGVVAQAWRGSARQAPIARMLSSKAVKVVPLDDTQARRIGLLLGRTGTSDVVDASVALLARPLGATVITSDPDDLTAIDAGLRIRTV